MLLPSTSSPSVGREVDFRYYYNRVGQMQWETRKGLNGHYRKGAQLAGRQIFGLFRGFSFLLIRWLISTCVIVSLCRRISMQVMSTTKV